ncbi:MAG TPA: histidine kinase, partial [Gemmatimonadaceae bacterium]
EIFRLLGMGCVMFAVFALILASALNAIGVAEGDVAGRARPSPVHRLLDRQPALTIAATILFALGAGLVLPSITHSLIFVPIAAGMLWAAVLAARSALETSRLLFNETLRRSEQAERARADAVHARLQALQAQLNPHFLFNALNTVASLVRTNPVRAERTVEQLALVLRRTLTHSANPFTTLHDEADYVRAYLAVEQERWGDDLHVTWELAADTLDVLLPSMTLQTLVENALKHGVGQRLDGGAVTIASTRVADTVELTVSDDGPGFDPGWREGTGLANLRQRLAALGRGRAELKVTTSEGTGATICVRLPHGASMGSGSTDRSSPNLSPLPASGN